MSSEGSYLLDASANGDDVFFFAEAVVWAARAVAGECEPPGCRGCGLVRAGRSWVTLVEWWNGSEWALQIGPLPADVSGGVQWCVVPIGDVCIAVGEADDDGEGFAPAVAERWNGTEWAVRRAPNEVEAAYHGEGVCRARRLPRVRLSVDMRTAEAAIVAG